MSPGLAGVLAPTILVTRLVWFALTAAIPIYVLVARFVAPQPSVAIPPAALLATFVTLAIGLAFAALVLPRVYPSDGLLARLLAEEASAEVVAAALAPGSIETEKVRGLDAIERRLLMVAPLFRAQSMIRSALAEAIAILGLVLVFLCGNFLYIAPFATLAIVIQLLAFPRIEPLIERGRPLVRP